MDLIGEVIRGSASSLPGRLCVDLLFVFLIVRGVFTRLSRHRD